MVTVHNKITLNTNKIGTHVRKNGRCLRWRLDSWTFDWRNSRAFCWREMKESTHIVYHWTGRRHCTFCGEKCKTTIVNSSWSSVDCDNSWSCEWMPLPAAWRLPGLQALLHRRKVKHLNMNAANWQHIKLSLFSRNILSAWRGNFFKIRIYLWANEWATSASSSRLFRIFLPLERSGTLTESILIAACSRSYRNTTGSLDKMASGGWLTVSYVWQTSSTTEITSFISIAPNCILTKPLHIDGTNKSWIYTYVSRALLGCPRD